MNLRRLKTGLLSATGALLALNVVAYVIVAALPRDVEPELSLSLGGLRSGRFWQLLTYQLMHANVWHLLVNCWMLCLFGPDVERTLGKTLYVILYFAGGCFGGVLHAFAALVWPYYFNTSVVGASAGIFGVMSAFALLHPREPFTLLLFAKMRAHTLLLLMLGLTALGIAYPRSPFSGRMAHVAHLGGMLTGLAIVRLRELFRGRDVD